MDTVLHCSCDVVHWAVGGNIAHLVATCNLGLSKCGVWLLVIIVLRSRQDVPVSPTMQGRKGVMRGVAVGPGLSRVVVVRLQAAPCEWPVLHQRPEVW